MTQSQQPKGPLPINGIRQNEQKYSSSSALSTSSSSGANFWLTTANSQQVADSTMNPPAHMNGRGYIPKPNPKHEQTAMLPPLSALPAMPAMPQLPSLVHALPSAPSGGGDIENILKLMTSRTMPLEKIQATPRNEVEVLTPIKTPVYAALPSFKPPIKPGRHIFKMSTLEIFPNSYRKNIRKISSIFWLD
jgi:hypothetical protein